MSTTLHSTLPPWPREWFAARLTLQSLSERQPHLAVAAQLALLLLFPCGLALAIDARTVNGISVWIKPAKFLLSFALYYATLAWAFGFLPRRAWFTRAGKFVIYGALIAGALEMIWLLSAAVAGVPSHFNTGSPIWGLAYTAAGIGSVVLVSAVLVQGLMIARQRDLQIAPALRWSLVAGALIAFAATLVTAGYLASGTDHWVGGDATDATGITLLGWSQTGGDLRVAHFWSLHAQQLLPIAGLLLVAAGRPQARATVVLAALAYLGLIAATFVQALNGQPFLSFAS